MATWPPDLPQRWLMAGHESLRVDGREAFDPSAGPPIRRSRFTKEHKIHRVQLIMRDAQFDLLEAWWEAAPSTAPAGLGGGVQPFDWTGPDGSSRLYEFAFLEAPRWTILIPARAPHPDATGSSLDYGIDDSLARLQRDLRVNLALVEADYWVP